MDILFNQGSLTWDTFATNRKAKLNELAAKFAGLSLEDFENFKWWTGFDDDKMLVKGMSPSQALSAVTVGCCEKLPLIDLSKESDLNAFGHLFGYNKGPLNVTRAQFDAYKDYITGAKKWDLPDIAYPTRSTIAQIYVDGVLMDL